MISRNSKACEDSGTVCSRLAFMRSAGIIQANSSVTRTGVRADDAKCLFRMTCAHRPDDWLMCLRIKIAARPDFFDGYANHFTY